MWCVHGVDPACPLNSNLGSSQARHLGHLVDCCEVAIVRGFHAQVCASALHALHMLCFVCWPRISVKVSAGIPVTVRGMARDLFGFVEEPHPNSSLGNSRGGAC